MPRRRKIRDAQGEVTELRKACGRWLREKREGAGLSQRVLAEKLGVD